MKQVANNYRKYCMSQKQDCGKKRQEKSNEKMQYLITTSGTNEILSGNPFRSPPGKKSKETEIHRKIHYESPLRDCKLK